MGYSRYVRSVTLSIRFLASCSESVAGSLASSLGGVKWRFHDVKLGDHIENAFHMMALQEHRFYFDVTLWESKDKKRSPANFEQCWMAGDHSNVGGSWYDQQLSDISLAWMTSRFEALGVKFDQTYLCSEILKFKIFVRDIALNLPAPDNWLGKSPVGIKAAHIARIWYQDDGEKVSPNCSGYEKGRHSYLLLLGRTHNVYYDTPHAQKKLLCGNDWDYNRIPRWYRGPVWASTSSNDSVEFTGPFLKNTNETFHPAIRYRRFCSRHDTLGYNELVGFNPGELQKDKGWEYPPAQTDGRIGNGTLVASTGPLAYKFTRTEKGKSEVLPPYLETTMGKHELLYLAFYDQDEKSQTGDPSVWKQVLGGDGYVLHIFLR